MAGTLYVCATPIGNLDDMTFRVVKCLQSVDVIAAEDTRNSIKLLNHFEIKTPMTAYHEFNKYDKARALVQDMLAGKILQKDTELTRQGGIYELTASVRCEEMIARQVRASILKEETIP